jgi:HEAT repeat protein
MINFVTKVVPRIFLVAVVFSLLAGGEVFAQGNNIDRLIKDLQSDNSEVRKKASQELSRIGSPSVPKLIEFIEDSEKDGERIEAIKTLGHIKDKKAHEFLCEIFADDFEEDPVRRAAYSEIKDSDDAVVNEALRSIIENEDDEEWARHKALSEVVKRKDIGAVEVIIDVMEYEEDEKFKKAIAQALESLTGQKFGTDTEEWNTWWNKNKTQNK